MSEILIKNTLNLKIKTPNGYESFAGIRRSFVNVLCVVSYTDGTLTECTENHLFQTNRGMIQAQNLRVGDRLQSKFVSDISRKYGKFPVYDPVEVGSDHLYYSDDVISHNCSFLGSSATLINGVKLRSIPYRDPINMEDFKNNTRDVVAVFEKPIQDHKYVVTVDSSEARDKDFSAFVIFDVTAAPYRIVARFRSNTIPIMMYPTKIAEVARIYNDAWILVETNSVGHSVAHGLKTEIGYENMFYIDFRGRGGQQLANHGTVGVKTSKATKQTGCQYLKTLVETDQLVLNDFQIWSELSTYVMKPNGTFSADSGKNDDLAMCLVLFAWLVKQEYFKVLFENDILEAVMEVEQEKYAQDMAPMNVMVGLGIGPTVESFFYNGEFEYDDPMFGKW